MTAKDSVNHQTILLVDDEEEILFSTAIMLKKAVTARIHTISDSTRVMPFLETVEVSLVVLDLHMPGITGQELLQKITYSYPNVPVLIVTAANTIEVAVDCMKSGAFDYLLKPIEKSRLITSVTRALEVFRLRSEVNSLRQHLLTGELQHEAVFAPIVTQNKRMRALFQYLESVACSDQPVLVTGETGVGKELFAKAIHDLCGRKGHFVAVNIAGLDDLMFSDSLFGHRKGAYTGADQAREGFITRAENGTLFLDEIGDMNAASQVKMLRLLQEHEYYPLGSDVAKRSATRIIAATNRDLRSMIAAGEFRNDLYFRLGAHVCHIPPLRERREDIPLLLEHFLEFISTKLHKKKPRYPEALVSLLSTYSFPGNVREFQTMVYDAVAQHTSGPLSLAVFRDKIGVGTAPEDSPSPSALTSETCVVFQGFPTLKEAGELLTERALALANGNQGVAASLLGLTRTAFNNRLTRKKKTA
ncbi:sigma-54 dependent transcriptional regulator [Geobacter sp. SVR]|uniref:sigma-54-dependent transcriptional regulator n=1 Tax=Geobacter sp. SVR TaxID=2495594 RepID=UPI00143F004C|nr:sigma-54 dependent transcriptional regulator [Geobacter sp. SVR]BCS52688.1 sigma-54-dependent Fis family transcriptional regulator [Geobacter sp. SVR]GCF86817.1 sigma-54-dependent Fis family transcriptional regulator [Geobacter sp. SVR]